MSTEGDARRAQHDIDRAKLEEQAKDRVARMAGGATKDAVKGFSAAKFGNHPEWYSLVPGSESLAQISFLDPVAGLVKLANSKHTTNYAILVINWLPSLGCGYAQKETGTLGDRPMVSGVPWTAMNTELLWKYITIRKENSGAKNYEPSDIGKILFAVNEVIADYAELLRIYGSLLNCSKNQNLNRILRPVLCPETSDIQLANRMADIKQTLIQANRRLASIPIPNIPYFSRTWYLCTSVFKDEDLDKSKIILYKREAFGMFQHTDIYPDAIKFRPNIMEYGSVNAIGSRLTKLLERIQAIQDYSEAATILGDVEKAYGRFNLLPDFDESYVTTPIYDPRILTQIDNTTLVGNPIWSENTTDQHPEVYSCYDVFDMSGYLFQGAPTSVASKNVLAALWPMFVGNDEAFVDVQAHNVMKDAFIDSPYDDPTPADNLVLSHNLATNFLYFTEDDVPDGVPGWVSEFMTPGVVMGATNNLTNADGYIVQRHPGNPDAQTVHEDLAAFDRAIPAWVPDVHCSEYFTTADFFIFTEKKIFVTGSLNMGPTFSYGGNSLTGEFEAVGNYFEFTHAPQQFIGTNNPILMTPTNNVIAVDSAWLRRVHVNAAQSMWINATNDRSHSTDHDSRGGRKRRQKGK